MHRFLTAVPDKRHLRNIRGWHETMRPNGRWCYRSRVRHSALLAGNSAHLRQWLLIGLRIRIHKLRKYVGSERHRSLLSAAFVARHERGARRTRQKENVTTNDFNEGVGTKADRELLSVAIDSHTQGRAVPMAGRSSSGDSHELAQSCRHSRSDGAG